MGVAQRGQIPLENISVELQVSSDKSIPGRFGARERVTLQGRMDVQQRQRLDRTIEYCPVGQLFGKGLVSIDDQIESLTGTSAISATGATTNFPLAAGLMPGTICARYLPETKVWKNISGSPVLEHEGEVKLYFSCERPAGVRRWVMLSGHTVSWNPIPMHLAVGGLAASTVATLRQILAPRPLDRRDLQVEIKMEQSSRGRQNAQAAAAEGVVRRYQLTRRIILGEPLSATPRESIHTALQQDPVSRYFRDGNILLEKEVIVSEPF